MKMLHLKQSAILLFIILYVEYTISLKLIELQVPTHVPLGIRAVLFCHWGLSPNDILYSVKWYKDGKEFFRHVPKDEEPIRKFLHSGVNVEEFNSSGSTLTLAPAVLATSGRYRCEVSGERPQFQTVSEYADMLVVVLPSHGPSILGLKSRYYVGDHINVSCTSGQAQAAVKLAWYINGEPALPTMVPRPVYVEDNEGTISLGMEFIVTESLVGNLKLQCLATIASIYWRSIEKSAVLSKTRDDIDDTHILKDIAVLTNPKNTNSGPERTKQHYVYFCILFIWFQP